MINFLATHSHLLAIGTAALITGIFALRGFYRTYDDELAENDEDASDDRETVLRYRAGHWKKTLAVAAFVGPLMASLVWVPAGYAGVVFDAEKGILEQELNSGLNIVVPFKQFVTNVNTRVQVFRHNNENVWQHTKDTQEIRVPFAVNYRISDASYFFENVAGGAETIIVPSSLRALRSSVGDYALEQIAPKQNEINEKIEKEISNPLSAQGIEVVYVAIEDTIARDGIIQAIEQEKIAARGIITARHNKQIAKLTAEATIETAKGQAASVVLVAKAEEERLNRLDMTPLEYIWFTRDNLVLPQVVAGGSTEFILPVPEVVETEEE